MAWTSSSSKNKLTGPERTALARLASVRRQRQPFEALARRVVAAILKRYLSEEGPIVEIGMGDGQLRERLPEALLPRVLHTEPLAAASRAFRKQHPDVVVVQASAEKLPVESGEAAAVLGSCVLDVVADGPAVVRELARALRPGRRFVHFLDMSTVLAPAVAALEGSGLVLFPNVFGDPAEAEWPEDLFLIPRDQLALIVALLERAGHASSRPLAQYLAVFSSSPLRVGAAAAELVQLQDDSVLRDALKGAFKSAFALAPPDIRLQLGRFQGRPVSSARLFEQRLRSWFSTEAGFQVELSGVERVWEHVARRPPGFAYRSCWVGEQRHLPAPPGVFLCAAAEPADEQHTLVELGVFVFVAKRI